jgi:membrane protease YdiL (CAAX protease family)
MAAARSRPCVDPYRWFGGLIVAWCLGLHLPGWYFLGSLRASQAATAVSIVVIGLVAGNAKRLGRSTWAAITVHFVSNLYSAFAG